MKRNKRYPEKEKATELIEALITKALSVQCRKINEHLIFEFKQKIRRLGRKVGRGVVKRQQPEHLVKNLRSIPVLI